MGNQRQRKRDRENQQRADRERRQRVGRLGQFGAAPAKPQMTDEQRETLARWLADDRILSGEELREVTGWRTIADGDDRARILHLERRQDRLRRAVDGYAAHNGKRRNPGATRGTA
jgi:hypothetical protein